MIVMSPAVGQVDHLQYIDSILHLANTAKTDSAKAHYYNGLSFTLIEYDPVVGIQYGRQALAMASGTEQKVQQANAYNNIGSNYLMLTQFDSSIWYYSRALQLFEENGSDKGKADIIGNIAMLYYYKGDYGLSLQKHFEALQIFERIENKPGMANIYSGIGNLYMEQKQYFTAIKYDSLALKVYQSLKDISGEALIFGNLANIYEDIGEREGAISCYEKAIKLYEELNQMGGLGRNLSNLSTIYQNKRDYRKALDLLERALYCFKQIPYLDGIIMASGNIGVNYMLCHKFRNHPDSVVSLVQASAAILLQEAESYLRSSVELAEQTGSLNAISFFSLELSKVYEQMKDFSKAYHYRILHHRSRDSLFNEESKISIENLTTQREVELKNKQIEIDTLAVEKKRIERWYFIIVLGLLSSASIFIYRNYRNQRHANMQLSSLNEKIALQHIKLADKNSVLNSTLETLHKTQNELIQSEKQKENAMLRSKISQDIHDDISSMLTKISWLAETLKLKTLNFLNPTPIEKINYLSRDSTQKLGEIIWSTNPDNDNLSSLLSYLRSYLNKKTEGANIHCLMDFPDLVTEQALNPELRRKLFQIFKQAIYLTLEIQRASRLHFKFIVEDQKYFMEFSFERQSNIDSSPVFLEETKKLMEKMNDIQGQLKMEDGQKSTMIFQGLFY